MTRHEYDLEVCASKVSWPTKGRAALAADALARKGRGRAWAYRCRVGRHWHVTTKPPGSSLPRLEQPQARRRWRWDPWAVGPGMAA